MARAANGAALLTKAGLIETDQPQRPGDAVRAEYSQRPSPTAPQYLQACHDDENVAEKSPQTPRSRSSRETERRLLMEEPCERLCD